MPEQGRKIKLIIAVPSLECGGLERNVSMICNHINTEKFEVTLLVVNNSKPFYSITNPAIKITDLQCSNVRSSVFRISKIAKEIKPDIILSAANHLNLIIAIFRWMFPRHIKMIARESSIVSINSKRAKNAGLYNWLQEKFYHKIDKVVCQSAYMQQDLLAYYHFPLSRTVIINNAVEVPAVEISQPVKDKPAIPVFITVARLSEEKGLDRILRSLAKLDIPFLYHIVGEGPMRPQLQALINELALQSKVSLAGSSSAPFSSIKNPDLFLMGSHYEGFPNVLLEANALGIPVVAFNAPGGIAEVIRERENGLLVEDGNEAAFANAIKEALLGNFNRELIRNKTIEQYAPGKIMQQWESLLLAEIR